LEYFKKITIEAHPINPEKFKPWNIHDVEKLSPTATIVEVLHPPLNGTEAQIERRQIYWEYLWDAGLCAFEIERPGSQENLQYIPLPPLAVDHSIAPEKTTAVLPPNDAAVIPPNEIQADAPKTEETLPEEIPVPIRFYVNGANTPEGAIASLFHKNSEEHQVHDFLLSQPPQTGVQIRGPKYLWKYPLGVTTIHGVTTVQSVLFIAGDSTSIPAALQVARKMLTTHFNLDMRIILLSPPGSTPEALPSDLAEWQKKFPGRLSLQRCNFKKDGQLRKQIKNGFADIGAFEVDEQGSRLVIVSLPPDKYGRKDGVGESTALTQINETNIKQSITEIINQLTGGEKNKDLEVVDISDLK